MKLFRDNIFPNKEMLMDLLKHVDLFNTINGGTAMTSVDIIGSEDSVIIKVSAPTVRADAFNILLNYTRLTISIWAREEEESYNTRPVLIPTFVRTFDLPALVDLENIEAIHEEGALKVTLPLKDNADGLQRIIDIQGM